MVCDFLEACSGVGLFFDSIHFIMLLIVSSSLWASTMSSHEIVLTGTLSVCSLSSSSTFGFVVKAVTQLIVPAYCSETYD